MKKEILYRYTSKGEGIFSIGKRLLPKDLVNEVMDNKKWIIKPKLSEGEYRFYLTEKGKEMYEKTLLISHKKYLSNIRVESMDRKKVKNVAYEDEYQVVEKL